MKKTFATAVLMMAILLISVQSQPRDQVEETIRQLNAQEVGALLRNDVKALDALWSKDFVVTNGIVRLSGGRCKSDYFCGILH